MSRAKKDFPVRFPEFQTAFNELMGDMTIKEFAEKLNMDFIQRGNEYQTLWE